MSYLDIFFKGQFHILIGYFMFIFYFIYLFTILLFYYFI